MLDLEHSFAALLLLDGVVDIGGSHGDNAHGFLQIVVVRVGLWRVLDQLCEQQTVSRNALNGHDKVR